MTKFKTLEWKHDRLILLDQTQLPSKEINYVCNKWYDAAEAIKKLVVRGAPAIGAAAAYAMVLAYDEYQGLSDWLRKFEIAAVELKATRPTAVNLFGAIDIMLGCARRDAELSCGEIRENLIKTANEVFFTDVDANERIGIFGAELFNGKVNVLTHCNAGALATCGIGTALGVVRKLHEQSKLKMVFSDETRPLLQGSRLTAWELSQDKIPVTVICDNMAAWIMKQGLVDVVITGADRVALNGDSANKIGTYGLSILAREHNIPFYIAAPVSTFDFNSENGEMINIEQRSKQEIYYIENIQTAATAADVYNPAFDVTPAANITGIITEFGVLYPDYKKTINDLRGNL